MANILIPEPLQTQRFHLRPLEKSDGKAMHRIFGDEQVMAYWSSPAHKNLAETQEYISENMPGSQFVTWAIVEKNDPENRALGWVCLCDVRDYVMEIGYILSRDKWGAGIMREAVKAVITHGFTAMKLEKIKADTDPDNIASNAILEYHGFQKEGYLRGEWYTHLGKRDAIIWGLLREDWQN